MNYLNRLSCLTVVIFVIALAPIDLLGQGTAEDYKRSSELAQKYRQACPDKQFVYRWCAGGIAIKSDNNGQPIYRFVDGSTGEQRVASKLEELGADVDSVDLKPRSQWGPSKAGGAAVKMLIENMFDRPIRIFWCRFDGSLQMFGSLEPGEKRAISTFGRHQWIMDFSANDLAGVFVAEDWPCVARVNHASQSIAMGASAKGSSKSSRDFRLDVRSHNVWGMVPEGDSKQLTNDGTAEDRYLSEFFTSPDGRFAVAFQATPRSKRRIPLVDSTPDDQVQPKVRWMNYPKPGDPVPQRRPRLFDLENMKQITVEDRSFEDSWSVDFKGWSRDGAFAYFLYNRRGHQQLTLSSLHLLSGEIRKVIDESSETFVDYSQKFYMKSLKQRDEIIWASERDGWNHLYRFDSKSGKLINQITTGQWLVRNVEYVDEENQVIWFTAMGIHPGQNPYYRHFARVNFDGSGLAVLTHSDGDHECELNPERNLVLARWSRGDHGEVAELRDARDGGLVAEVFEQDVSALAAVGYIPPILFSAPGRDGKTQIYGQLILPSNFDSDNQYPVIENVYAGPHDFHVPPRFGLQISQRRLAELGFVVARIDGMGTNWRSKSFHDVCYQNLADGGFPDRILWLQAAAKKYHWIDLSKVGVYGGSAGGQNALAALLHHGDFYQAAVSDCGCHDNRMDKIWWNEAWMGELGPHYAENSNVTHASNLNGDLLLTVGELDSNVDPASTMQVVDALVRADKDFELVVYPGAGHGIGESPYLFRRRQDFFVRSLLNLKPRR